MLDPYSPEPYSDFSDPKNQAAYAAALARVESELGKHAPLLIGGDRIQTRAVIESIDPSRPDRVVGSASSAVPDHAEQALDAAWAAFPGWSARTAEERAGLIHRVGDIIASRRYEFAAWQTFEAGKNYGEAEADVAEAVDFCRYYAHQALEMEYYNTGQVGQSP